LNIAIRVEKKPGHLGFIVFLGGYFDMIVYFASYNQDCGLAPYRLFTATC